MPIRWLSPAPHVPRSVSRVAARLALATVAAACADGGQRDCVPFATQRCWCPGAAESAQACTAVGTWEPCRCEASPPPDSDATTPDAPPDASSPPTSDGGPADDITDAADGAVGADTSPADAASPLDASPMDTSGSVDPPDTAFALPNGAALYAANCAVCHGPQGQGGAAGPSLLETLEESSDARLGRTIRRGDDGMPAFYWFTDDELTALIDWMRATLGP